MLAASVDDEQVGLVSGLSSKLRTDRVADNSGQRQHQSHHPEIEQKFGA